MFAAWVADQELQSVKRRTKEGLERAGEKGKVLGPPRKFRPHQVEAMRRMRDGGASLRRIAADFECSASTVLRDAAAGRSDKRLIPDQPAHSRSGPRDPVQLKLLWGEL